MPSSASPEETKHSKSNLFRKQPPRDWLAWEGTARSAACARRSIMRSLSRRWKRWQISCENFGASTARGTCSWQIEEKKVGRCLPARRPGELQRSLSGDARLVSGAKRPSVDAQLARDQEQVSVAAGREPMRHRVYRAQQRREDGCVLMNVHHTGLRLSVAGLLLRAGRRRRDSNRQQFAGARGERESLLLPRRSQTVLRRQDPELHEVQRLILRGVVFGMAYARACAHALNFAGRDLAGVAQAVAVFQRAGDHVGHDLHLAVAVHWEAAARRDDVVVEHAQRAEGDVFRVMIMVKREMPARVQPVRLETIALGVRNNLEHGKFSSVRGSQL